ncbi:MAG TPA: hypothetical protein PKD12_02825 [Nitrospira sp.]|nr:hypothetical protein [Nitrospira sp.]
MDHQQDTEPAGAAVADNEPYASLKSLLDAEMVRDATQQAAPRTNPTDRGRTTSVPATATRLSVQYGLD